MATQPSKPVGNASSLSGRPHAFSHVSDARSSFKPAASGERAKAKQRANPRQIKKNFSAAHEGPREKLAEPRKQPVPTPNGSDVQEVHTQVEREKQARNRRRDRQMKKWRERRIEPSHGVRSTQDLRKQTPDVHLKAEKKRQFQEVQKAKRAMRRGRSR